MQTDRTRKFWDDYHKENDHKEWISQPSEELIKLIQSDLILGSLLYSNKNKNINNDEQKIKDSKEGKGKVTTTIHMLEIGCGTSILARDLWQRLIHANNDMNNENDNNNDNHQYVFHMCATDVSEVCIQVNQQRDAELLLKYSNSNNTDSVAKPATVSPSECNTSTDDSSSCRSNSNNDDESNHDHHHSLEYRVLNVLEDQPPHSSWNVILDKGCVDTFLFRSKNRGENHAYTNILEKVLNNIWTWMATDGVFLVISPRSKLKAVRDFSGFSSVERHSLSEESRGELVGEKSNMAETPAYVYVCRKDVHYQIGKSPAYKFDFRKLPDDDAQCPSCGLTFFELRKGEAAEGRGVVFWTRQWKGHCIHCKAPHKYGFTSVK